jgi:hypothetical protein
MFDQMLLTLEEVIVASVPGLWLAENFQTSTWNYAWQLNCKSEVRDGYLPVKNSLAVHRIAEIVIGVQETTR